MRVKGIEVRKMKKKEFEDVIELVLEEIYDDLSSSLTNLIERTLRNSGKPPYIQWFVAQDDEILGFIAWLIEDLFSNPDEIFLEIAWIAVEEESQGKGIGRRLIKDSLLEVKQSLPDVKITITVTADDKDAQAFYRSVLNPFLEAKEPRGRIRFWANV